MGNTRWPQFPRPLATEEREEINENSSESRTIYPGCRERDPFPWGLLASAGIFRKRIDFQQALTRRGQFINISLNKFNARLKVSYVWRFVKSRPLRNLYTNTLLTSTLYQKPVASFNLLFLRVSALNSQENHNPQRLLCYPLYTSITVSVWKQSFLQKPRPTFLSLLRESINLLLTRFLCA